MMLCEDCRAPAGEDHQHWCRYVTRVLYSEAKVCVPLTVAQCEELADRTLDLKTRDLLLRALGLLDPRREAEIRRENMPPEAAAQEEEIDEDARTEPE